MHVTASPNVAPPVSGHVGAEQALTPGPWHQPWPFHCFYCSEKFSDNKHYPYCSIVCAIHGENS